MGRCAIAILSAIFMTASAAQANQAERWESLGFEVMSRSALRSELRDAKTRTRLKFEFEKTGKLKESTTLDPAGRTVAIRRYLPDRLWRWSRQGEQVLIDEWFLQPAKIHRQTLLDSANRVLKKIERPFRSEDHEQDCPEQGDPLKALNEQITRLDLPLDRLSMDGCRTYPGGEENLWRDLRIALDQGLECMAKSSTATRLEAAELVGLVGPEQRNVTLACGTPNHPPVVGGSPVAIGSSTLARAMIPPEPHSPGMLLNLAELRWASHKDRWQTLFHEMLHWTGALHGHGFDTPYVAEICCFPGESTENQKRACDLMNRDPRPEENSADYLSEFAVLMVRNFRSVIAYRDLLETLVAEGAGDTEFKAAALAVQGLDGIRDPGAVVLASFMAEMRPGLAPATPEARGAMGAEGSAVAARIGKLGAMMEKKTGYPVYALEIEILKSEINAYLSSLEGASKDLARERIKNWLGLFRYSSLKIRVSSEESQTAAFELWKGLDQFP